MSLLKEWFWLHVLLWVGAWLVTQDFGDAVRFVMRCLWFEISCIFGAVVIVFVLLARIATWLLSVVDSASHQDAQTQKPARDAKSRAKKQKAPRYDCDGGELLERIGPAWFVNYMYFHKIDRSCKDWSAVGNKITTYMASAQYHLKWLEFILTLDDSELKDSYADADEIRERAQKLIKHLAPKQ